MQLVLTAHNFETEVDPEDFSSSFPLIKFTGHTYDSDKIVFEWTTENGLSPEKWELLAAGEINTRISVNDWNGGQYISISDEECEFTIMGNNGNTISTLELAGCTDAFANAARITRRWINKRASLGLIEVV